MSNLRLFSFLFILFFVLSTGVFAADKRFSQPPADFPFTDDFNDYLSRPDEKAWAMFFNCELGTAYGAAGGYEEQYSASQAALERCNASLPDINLPGECFLYAQGNSIVSNASFYCPDVPDTSTGVTDPFGTQSPDLPTTGTSSATGSTPYVVENDIGSALILTPISADTAHASVPDAHAVITGEGDEITLIDSDNTKVTIKPNSIFIQQSQQSDGTQTTKTVSLLKGTVVLEVPKAFREYILMTPVADIVVASYEKVTDPQLNPNVFSMSGYVIGLINEVIGLDKRINPISDILGSGSTPTPTSSTSTTSEDASFTTTYSQDGLDGTATVSVDTGSVEVTDREGNTTTLNAGEEKTIQGRVPRTSWVTPIDNDKFYGGEDNMFIWTEFSGAKGYSLEFNVPQPIFSEENTSTPEFKEQYIPLPSSALVINNGLVTFVLPFPKGADGRDIFCHTSLGNIFIS